MRASIIILLCISTLVNAEITGNFELGHDCKSIHLALGGNENLNKRWREERYNFAFLEYPGEYYSYPAKYSLLCNSSHGIVSVVTIYIDVSSSSEHEELSQLLRKKFENKFKTIGVDLTKANSSDIKKPTHTTHWENEEIDVLLMFSNYVDSSKVVVSIEKKNE